MTSIKNTVEFINDNWSMICVCIVILIGLYNKIVRTVKKFTSGNKEDIVKNIVDNLQDEILKMISDAEVYWADYEKSGDIKRSKVIADIFEKYPILAEYVDRQYILDVIDELIEEAKPTMDKIINNIEPEEEPEEEEVEEEASEDTEEDE